MNALGIRLTYSSSDFHSISFCPCSNMFKIHLHFFSIFLVLSNNIESRNILKKSKPVFETSGEKVVKTGIITKWLRQKDTKILFLYSFLLLAKPQVQIVVANKELAKPPQEWDNMRAASRGSESAGLSGPSTYISSASDYMLCCLHLE